MNYYYLCVLECLPTATVVTIATQIKSPWPQVPDIVVKQAVTIPLKKGIEKGMDEVIESSDEYKPMYSLQQVGNVIFDSNAARKGPNGTLIVRDLETEKDYGVVRQKDGSYDFVRSKNKET